MVLSSKSSRDHIGFWIGGSLEFFGFQDVYQHFTLNHNKARQSYCPKVFNKMKDLLVEGYACERYSVSSPLTVSTKEIYKSFTDTMPPPKVEFKYPDRDWILVWRRLNNGVISQIARNYLYFIIHERVPTKERLHRFSRIESPTCIICMDGPESQHHRYVLCRAVSEAWLTIRDLIESVDFELVFESDCSLLHFYFNSTCRENAVLWLIGEYVSLVESEVVLKNNSLSSKKIIDHLSTRQLECRNLSLPDIGLIPGLSPMGIG